MKSFSLFLLLITSACHASALTISLSEVASRVRTHHPALRAARLAVEEAKGRQLAAGRLTNPTLNFDFQTQSNLSPQTSVISIDQSFPITRRLSLEKKLTAQFVSAADLEIQDVERRLISEAQQQVVQLLTLSKQRVLRQQQTELAKELSEFAHERAKAGEVSPLDANQAQLDAQRLRVESRLLEAQSVSLLEKLKPMLGLRSEDSLSIAGDLPSMSVPDPPAWTLRPDYQLAQTKIAAAETTRHMAQAKRLPDVTGGFLASHEMQDFTPMRSERTGFVGFRISVPLPFWNRNQGEIAETEAAVERARLESEALALQINGEVGAARREMETNASIVHETRDTLLPLAVEQSAAMQKAYESGQADLLSVLRARDQRLQLEAASLDALRDFHLARVRYEAATGARLP